mgnify:CR=1 FL=1
MLNKDTIKLIDYFIHDYRYNVELKNNNNNLFEQIYHQLNTLDNINLKTNLLVDTFKSFDLLSSSFIPKHIKMEIKKKKKIYTYRSDINNSNTKIYIKFYVSEYSKINITKQKQMLKKILLLINFLFLYKSNNTINNLTIHIHMSKHKKFLPKNNTEILNQNNVNTAVTYACAKEGECIIYRKEEWFKVLIHELMHSLCLDFSSSNYNSLKKKIHSIFPVNSTFYISETYAEFWATILNCIFTSYYSTDNGSNFKTLDQHVRGFKDDGAQVHSRYSTAHGHVQLHNNESIGYDAGLHISGHIEIFDPSATDNRKFINKILIILLILFLSPTKIIGAD